MLVLVVFRTKIRTDKNHTACTLVLFQTPHSATTLKRCGSVSKSTFCWTDVQCSGTADTRVLPKVLQVKSVCVWRLRKWTDVQVSGQAPLKVNKIDS